MDFKDLKACVELVLPLQCDTRGCDLNEEVMKSLLEATQHKVPLQELQVVYDQSGDFDQTALALEHLRWEKLILQLELTCFSTFFRRFEVYCPLLSSLSCMSVDSSTNTSGGVGMRKMKMMTLTTLFVMWNLV